ncbi:hypothetical protein JI435_413820, partial [Parastagonospora nodorum SN15]
ISTCTMGFGILFSMILPFRQIQLDLSNLIKYHCKHFVFFRARSRRNCPPSCCLSLGTARRLQTAFCRIVNQSQFARLWTTVCRSLVFPSLPSGVYMGVSHIAKVSSCLALANGYQPSCFLDRSFAYHCTLSSPTTRNTFYILPFSYQASFLSHH